MSRLRCPFLYDRCIFVSVDFLRSCSAGLALKPRGLSSSGGPVARRPKCVAVEEPQR